MEDLFGKCLSLVENRNKRYLDLLFTTLEFARHEAAKSFQSGEWKDVDDYVFSNLEFTKKEVEEIYKGRGKMVYAESAFDSDLGDVNVYIDYNEDEDVFSAKTTLEFTGGKREEVCGVGKTKEDAIEKLRFMLIKNRLRGVLKIEGHTKDAKKKLGYK